MSKETITAAVAEGGRAGEVRQAGTITNDLHALEKLLRRIRGERERTLHVCYEAGPCGFVIARRLRQLGIACTVVAPSLIPKKPGDRIKTDKRDAEKLARLLRAGDLSPVYVPDAIHRFAHPRQLMAYLGLVPTESTSSDTRKQGGITKCGNPHARWLLVECSQHYDTPPKVSKELSARQAKLDRRAKEASWRAQNRLHARFTRLRGRRLQRNKAMTTVARELTGFIWELLRELPCYTKPAVAQ